MTSTLYRKYRPQKFADVFGQADIKLTLENEIKTNKLAHAYLFCGMRGVGKTTLARILAKAVNCQKRKEGDSEPCDKCQSCEAISSGRSLDLIEIDAASNRRIDDIREVRDKVPYGTANSKYKVVIVDEVHMLTTEAFNALLKTLEEPPAHVIFILATTEVHKLPDTIVSRCQRFDFRRLSQADLVARLQSLIDLEKIKVDEEVLVEIAQLSGGSTRDAESFLGKVLTLGEKKITLEHAKIILPHSDINLAWQFVKSLVANEAGEAIMLLNKFIFEGGDLGHFYKQTVELLRQALIVKLGGKFEDFVGTQCSTEITTELNSLVKQINKSRWQNILSVWLKTENTWRQSEFVQLPLELAIAEICAFNEPEATPVAPKQVYAAAPIEPINKPNPVVVEKTAPVEQSSGAFNLQTVKAKWPEVISKLQVLNHSLSFILSVAKPINLVGNTLTVSFQYKLHKDRVNDRKIKTSIEEVMKTVYKLDLVLDTVLEEASNNKNSGDLLSSVLSTFGGQVVE